MFSNCLTIKLLYTKRFIFLLSIFIKIKNIFWFKWEIIKIKQSKGAIPSLLSDALAISFDPNVGHDYLEQADVRYDYYHRVLEKIPFDLEYFNKITRDGVPKKTLNIALAGCVHPATKIKVRIRKKF